jgi:hypothetical protein
MERKGFLLLEKLQVGLTAAGLLAVAWWGLRPMFTPADPLGPIALLPGGTSGNIWLFCLFVPIFSLIAAGTTTTSRPSGAMLASLLGLGGLAMRSGPMRTLFWGCDGSVSYLYLQMLVEILLLGLAVAVAELLIGLVRRHIAAAQPGWLWRDPLEDLTDQQRKILEKHTPANDRKVFWFSFNPAGMLLLNLAQRFVEKKMAQAQTDGIRKKLAGFRQQVLGCLATGVVLGLILVCLMMQSTQRGQVLFALFAGFICAAWLARHFFPVDSVFIAWAMPLITAVLFYALAAISYIHGTWVQISPQFQALPIDWLTAGGSGAMLGFWLSGRSREVHIAEVLHRASQSS